MPSSKCVLLIGRVRHCASFVHKSVDLSSRTALELQYKWLHFIYYLSVFLSLSLLYKYLNVTFDNHLSALCDTETNLQKARDHNI